MATCKIDAINTYRNKIFEIRLTFGITLTKYTTRKLYELKLKPIFLARSAPELITTNLHGKFAVIACASHCIFTAAD